ncbi:hypothetical protein DIPPA_53938, partial [Diplonema papillatum]
MKKGDLIVAILKRFVNVLVIVCSLASIGGLGLLVENEVNPNGSSLIEIGKEERELKGQIFFIASCVSYVAVGVMVILAEVKVRAFLNRAHFAETFLGKSLLQVFLGIEVLKQADYLNTLGLEIEMIYTGTLIVGWAMIGAGISTLLMYGLVVAPSKEDEESEEDSEKKGGFRGTICARAIALLVFLALGGLIFYFASTQGWSNDKPCSCLDYWYHGDMEYTGCSSTPEYDDSWCYVNETKAQNRNGKITCDGLESGLKDPSIDVELATNESMYLGWMQCTIPTTSVPLTMVPLTVAPHTNTPTDAPSIAPSTLMPASSHPTTASPPTTSPNGTDQPSPLPAPNATDVPSLAPGDTKPPHTSSPNTSQPETGMPTLAPGETISPSTSLPSTLQPSDTPSMAPGETMSPLTSPPTTSQPDASIVPGETISPPTSSPNTSEPETDTPSMVPGETIPPLTSSPNTSEPETDTPSMVPGETIPPL